jgi:hypothetical protein
MKAYGYKRKDCDNGLMELDEVTIFAGPDVLRNLADFILSCVAVMEKNPRDWWGHEHFTNPTGEDAPEFIICSPVTGKEAP